MDIGKRIGAAFMAMVMVLSLLPPVPGRAEELEITEPTTAATLPVQTIPETTAIPETLPEETASMEPATETATVPEETLPAYTIPEETTPEEILPEETATSKLEADAELAAAVVVSGSCGENLSWSYDRENATLTIFGEGPMYGYYNADRPWEDLKYYIQIIEIQEGVTTVGDGAFIGIEYLRKVTLPSTVELIDLYAFADCPKLEELLFPDNVTTLAYAAFRNCSSLVRLDLPQSLQSLEAGAFANCYSLEEITIPDGIREFGFSTFQNCLSLAQIRLPSSLEIIGQETFSGCLSLTEMTLPATLQYLGEASFADCYDLKQLRFTGSAPVIDGTEVFSEVQATVWYPAEDSTWTEAIRQNYGGTLNWRREGETEYPDSGSCGETLSWELDLETGVLTLSGSGAMADGCPWENYAGQITAVEFAADVTALGAGAFRGCKQLKDLVIPDSVTALGSNVFSGSGIRQLVFTGDMPQLQRDTFSGLKATAYYPSGNASWEKTPEEGDGIVWNAWGLVLDREELCLRSGETAVITAVFQPFNVTDTTILWSVEGESLTLKPEGETVTVTAQEVTETCQVILTATPADGCTGPVSRIITLMPEQKEEDLPADLTLIGGAATSLKALDEVTGKPLTSKQISWTLEKEYEPYALVTTAGRLTTRTVQEPVRIRVTGIRTGGAEPVVFRVDILPATAVVELQREGENVSGQTIYMDAAEERLTLTALVHPEGAMTEATWSVSDKGSYASYEQNGDTLTILNPTGKLGTVTVKATAADGSRKTASVKVAFAIQADKLTVNVKGAKEPADSCELVSGKSVTLAATLSREGKVPTNKKVTWSLQNPEDAEFVKLSTSGSVTAKTIYEPRDVVILAKAQDGGGAEDSFTVQLLPKQKDLLVLRSGGVNVTGQTRLLEPGQSIALEAWNLAENRMDETVIWSPSANRYGTMTRNEDGSLTVVMEKAGSLTVAAKDAQGRKAQVVLKCVKLVKTLEVVDKTTASGENLTLASGKSMNLAALLDGKTSSAVTWTLSGPFSRYATLSSSGRLTAASGLLISVPVTVTAAAKDGSGKTASVTVKLQPLVRGIRILADREVTNCTWQYDMAAGETLSLGARVYPLTLDQEVGWKSSSTRTATIDAETGEITCLKPGTVTITATAKDGSGVKATFKLQIVKNIRGLTMDNRVVAAGKTLDLSKVLQITPKDTTTKMLNWELLEGGEYATLSSKGVLKPKKTDEIRSLRIRVTAADDLAVSTECTVTVYPQAVNKLTLWRGDAEITGKTLQLQPGETLQLQYKHQPAEASDQVIWSSSNSSLAAVDPATGIVTAKSKGTVTITCAATDGSNRKASLRIRIP